MGFQGEGRGKRSTALRRRDAARSAGRSRSRSGAAARSARRVEAPGHAGHPRPGGAGHAHVGRRVAHHPGLARRSAQLGHQAEEPGRVRLAGGDVARAPDPGEAGGDAEPLEDGAAHVPRLVREDGEGRSREGVEGLRDAGVEPRRVEEALPVAVDVDREDLLGGEPEAGVAQAALDQEPRPLAHEREDGLEGERRRARGDAPEGGVDGGRDVAGGVDERSVEVEDDEPGQGSTRARRSRGPSASRASRGRAPGASGPGAARARPGPRPAPRAARRRG